MKFEFGASTGRDGSRFFLFCGRNMNPEGEKSEIRNEKMDCCVKPFFAFAVK
jgi:hypothetical protein